MVRIQFPPGVSRRTIGSSAGTFTPSSPYLKRPRLIATEVFGIRSRNRSGGRPHAYSPNCDFGSVRRRACHSAALGRQGAILSPLLAASTVLADLRGGRRSRYRHDNHQRAAPSAHGGAALLLQVLRTAARLPTAGLLRAGILRAAELFWATLSPPVSRRWRGWSSGWRWRSSSAGRETEISVRPFDPRRLL